MRAEEERSHWIDRKRKRNGATEMAVTQRRRITVTVRADFRMVARTAEANRAARMAGAAAHHADLVTRFDAIDERLRRVPDAHRSDILATLPTATAAMLAVILPLVGFVAVGIVVTVQLVLWLPVAYKVIRKL